MKYSRSIITVAGLSGLMVLAFMGISKTTTKVKVNPKPKIVLGINLSGVAYYATENPFIDAFKSSDSWHATLVNGSGKITKWDTGESKKIIKDSHGWVTTLKGKHQYNAVATLIYTGQNGRYPQGKDQQYIVRYQGQGKILYGGDAKLLNHFVLPDRTSQDLLKIQQSNSGISLVLTDIDPHDYPKNIRIIPRQYIKTYPKDIFNPDFLEIIKPFDTLRFMDWMGTNNGPEEMTWKDRTDYDSATWSRVPLEVMVALANKTNTNPWFNMPTGASDDYVRKFAKYVKAHLKPNLKIYIEYSNEVWNDGFGQADYSRKKGLAHHLSEDPSSAKLYWYTLRTRQIVDIWQQVYQGEQRRQINGVLCFGGYLSTRSELDYLQSHGGFDGIKVLAVAAYFGYYLGSPNVTDQLQSWNLDQLYGEITKGGILKGGPQGGALGETYRSIAQNASLAKKYNLQLVAYEGGQHLVGYSGSENNQAINDLFIRFNRDPRIAIVYDQFVTKWSQLGGGLFNHYSDITPYGKWGSWGAMESLREGNSPKYAALKKLLKQYPSQIKTK